VARSVMVRRNRRLRGHLFGLQGRLGMRHEPGPVRRGTQCVRTACTVAGGGQYCGDIGDGCGGTLHCGDCPGSGTCSNNVCPGWVVVRMCAAQLKCSSGTTSITGTVYDPAGKVPSTTSSSTSRMRRWPPSRPAPPVTPARLRCRVSPSPQRSRIRVATSR